MTVIVPDRARLIFRIARQHDLIRYRQSDRKFFSNICFETNNTLNSTGICQMLLIRTHKCPDKLKPHHTKNGHDKKARTCPIAVSVRPLCLMKGGAFTSAPHKSPLQ